MAQPLFRPLPRGDDLQFDFPWPRDEQTEASILLTIGFCRSPEGSSQRINTSRSIGPSIHCKGKSIHKVQHESLESSIQRERELLEEERVTRVENHNAVTTFMGKSQHTIASSRCENRGGRGQREDSHMTQIIPLPQALNMDMPVRHKSFG